MPPDPADPATRLLALLDARPATLGGGRLLCLDGPSGSGKTTLAGAVAAVRPDARVVHLDDLLEDWDGLTTLADRLVELVEPLAAGRSSGYRRWDWLRHRPSREVTVEPTPLLVLDGVGSGARALDPWRTVLAWVELPDADARLERAVARDGEPMRTPLRRWQQAEQRLFADERTRARADVEVWTHGESHGESQR